MKRARFYDGQEGRPRDVHLDVHTLDLRIIDAGTNTLLRTWPWQDVTVLDRPDGGTPGMLSLKGDEDCRLVIDGGAWVAVAAHVAQGGRHFGPGAIVLLCAASIAFIAAILFYSPQALDFAARFIPYSWEDQLGSLAVDTVTGTETCKGTPAAQKALERLATQLDEGGNSFEIRVVEDPMANALTFPGRRIVIFSGLLTLADGPEELAGVMAHEVGHAHFRHPIRAFTQSAGGKLLLGMALGDAAAVSQAMSMAGELLLLKGSRAYESESDAYAVTALLRNGFDAGGLAVFLEKMGKQFPEGLIPEWLNSHPVTGARVESLKKSIAAQDKKRAHKPPMTAAEWQAVRNFCGTVP